jgi:hypothetical protein
MLFAVWHGREDPGTAGPSILLTSRQISDDSPPLASSAEPGEGPFVWLVWVSLLALAVAYVVRFGPDVPLWDDYAVVPQLVGTHPVSLGWLWSQHSEHRIPLARLILLGVFRLSAADPRPVMLLCVGLLASLAAGLVLAVRKSRGRLLAADAFLPVVLLGLGHHENFLWAIQITYVMPVFLLGVVLTLIVGSRPFPSFRTLTLASVCMVLMPLCNAGGLAFIPALAAWIWVLSLAVAQGRTPLPRSRSIRIAVLPIPAVVLLLLYFRGYESPKHHAAAGAPAAALRTAVQFLGMGLGEPGATLWPWSGLIVVGLLLTAVLVQVVAWVRRPEERGQIEGFVWVLGATVCLALGTGWGRSGEDALAGLQPRYVTLAAPALLTAYLTFARYGPGLVRSLLPLCMMAGALVLLWPNTLEAWQAGSKAGAKAQAFDREVAAGTPLFRLVRRHVPFLHPSQEGLHEALELLRRAGIGKFRSIQPDPAFEERSIPLKPADVRLATWNGGRIEVTGPDPWIRFDLPSPVEVRGVRLSYSHSNPDGAPARFRLAWRGPAQLGPLGETQYGDWNLPTGPGRTTTVWIDELINQLRIQPDNRPCEFTLTELTLLLPTPRDPRNP